LLIKTDYKGIEIWSKTIEIAINGYPVEIKESEDHGFIF
jgi:hypothetical protein